MLGIFFADEDQHFDLRSLQDHVAPDCRSDLLFKGALRDQAHAVYSGWVRVRRSAEDERDADLPQPRAHRGCGPKSIPNLEIEANDVRCRHAASVGPIDEEQLYYLESRGVLGPEAERLIVLGFFDDVLDRLPVPTLARTLRRSVVEKRSAGMGQVRVCAVGDIAAGDKRLHRRRPQGGVAHIGAEVARRRQCSHEDYSLVEGDLWEDESRSSARSTGRRSREDGGAKTLPATGRCACTT